MTLTKENKKAAKSIISSAIKKALASHKYIKEKKFLKAIEKASGDIAKKAGKIEKEKTVKPVVKSTLKVIAPTVNKAAGAKSKPVAKKKAAPRKRPAPVKKK